MPLTDPDNCELTSDHIQPFALHLCIFNDLHVYSYLCYTCPHSLSMVHDFQQNDCPDIRPCDDAKTGKRTAVV